MTLDKTRSTFDRETSSVPGAPYVELEQSMATSRERIVEFSENDSQQATMLAEFDRARRFVLSCVGAYQSNPVYFSRIPIPTIDIGPEESVDVNWVADDRRLLLNFSPHEPEVSLAGIQRNGEGSSIQGHITADTPNAWIVSWLVG